MDNKNIHKSFIVKEIIENTGCALLYLAPYLPDLNPIKHDWANLKKFIAKIRHNSKSFHDAIDFAFS
jgi:transposase